MKKSPKRPLLYGESFSPWTKKARWALEHCGLPYDYKEYTPTLSEPELRWRLKQLNGSVSVPMLFVGRDTYRGSWEIAQYANASAGEELLGSLDTMTSWNSLSESALAEGRTNVVRCIASNNQALEESLPAFLPNFMHRSMRFVAHDAVKRLDKKYEHLVEPGAMRRALLLTREGLSTAGSDYLLDRFSYADISMAVVLEVFAPLAKTQPPLGPATQSCWNNAELAIEFKDLVDWRDRLAANDSTSYSQFRS